MLICFCPYLILPSFEKFRLERNSKSILFDVGANSFFASSKALIDSYSPYLTFDNVYLIEPDEAYKSVERSMKLPSTYQKKSNITFIKKMVRTGIRIINDRFVDVLTLLKGEVTVNDFVVLKYDVDEGASSGDTMEWGFLADLLVDSDAPTIFLF